MSALETRLRNHQQKLARCKRCPAMLGRPVHGNPVVSKVMLVGQAPGSKEMTLQKPFAWTAGKTLFGWFQSIGLGEAAFRDLVYMAAVCRCFPGKSPGGGDRVPSKVEVSNCSHWMGAELELLQPELIVPVGRLAIERFLAPTKLDALIGHVHTYPHGKRSLDVIPLPHPSGASVWHRIEPGKTLLTTALREIGRHPAWQQLCAHARDV